MLVARLLSSEIDELVTKERADDFHFPPGQPHLLNFPPHIVQYLYNGHVDQSLYEEYQQIPVHIWPIKCRGRSKIANKNYFLALDVGTIVGMMKASKIEHSGLGVLTLRIFENFYTVGFYYRSIFQCYLSRKQKPRNTYGNVYICVTLTDF